MVRDDHEQTEQRDGPIDRSRRNVLKLTGAAAGLATVAGASVVGAGQETEPEAGTETATPTGEAPDDEIHPVFGVPLASGESFGPGTPNIVEVTVETGDGAHEDFPQEEDEAGDLVEVPAEFLFDPVGLQVEPGALVRFDVTAGLHTVTAAHEKYSEPEFDVPTRIPTGAPAFTSPPLTPDESWIYRFPQKGVFDYLCLPHFGLGMVGRIVVFDTGVDDIESDLFAAPTAGPLPPDAARVLGAQELEPANVVEEGEVAWEDVTLAAPPGTETPTGTATETPSGTGTEMPSGTETEMG